MRCLPLALLLAAPAAAEFLEIRMQFVDSGCVPCTESLKPRLERVRGVEEVAVDLEAGAVWLKLAEDNRVRLKPLLARVEQDGTQIAALEAVAKGAVKERDGSLVLTLDGLEEEYRLEAEDALPRPGAAVVEGRIEEAESPTPVLHVEAVRR